MTTHMRSGQGFVAGSLIGTIGVVAALLRWMAAGSILGAVLGGVLLGLVPTRQKEPGCT